MQVVGILLGIPKIRKSISLEWESVLSWKLREGRPKCVRPSQGKDQSQIVLTSLPFALGELLIAEYCAIELCRGVSRTLARLPWCARSPCQIVRRPLGPDFTTSTSDEFERIVWSRIIESHTPRAAVFVEHHRRAVTDHFDLRPGKGGRDKLALQDELAVHGLKGDIRQGVPY
jgi:hypothetical protein